MHLENVPIETYNISLESTQNEQQYGATVTCTEGKEKEKKVMVIRILFFFKCGGVFGGGKSSLNLPRRCFP